MIPTDHQLLDLVVADALLEPEKWMAARPFSIGASDAAGYAKLESVEAYVRAKLTTVARPFAGNPFTAAGHAHEPGLMAWAGVTHNTRMFRHPEIPEFTATPDGVDVTPTGVVLLGEAKVKHRIVTGPTPAERRQVVWAQYVLGGEVTKWVWQALHPDTHRPYGEPQVHRISFDPDLLAPILVIAHHVRAAMIAARDFERNQS